MAGYIPAVSNVDSEETLINESVTYRRRLHSLFATGNFDSLSKKSNSFVLVIGGGEESRAL